MTAGNILNFNTPLGPCFVRVLYWVALVLIALGLVRGIVGGVRMMSGPPPVAVTAPASPDAMGAPPPGPQAGMPMRRGGPQFRGRRFRGRPGFMMGGPMLRGLPPPALGGLRIVLALLRALVMAMVVRILAEIANAILAMGAKAKAS